MHPASNRLKKGDLHFIVAMKLYLLTLLTPLMANINPLPKTDKNSIAVFIEINLEEQSSNENPLLNEIEYYYGLQYARKLTKHQLFQSYIGYSNIKSAYIGADYLYQLPSFMKHLSCLLGTGIVLEYTAESPNNIRERYFLIRPQASLDYHINKSPVAVFAAYKPKFDMQNFGPYDLSTLQLGINFQIK